MALIGLQMALGSAAEAAADPAVHRFLSRRVDEDIALAGRRALAPVPIPVSMAGLDALIEVRDELAAGKWPDESVVQMLLLGHQGHSEFDPDWSVDRVR
jgi:hypothetical protein